MTNLLVFAKPNQISADSGIPFVSLRQRGLVLTPEAAVSLTATCTSQRRMIASSSGDK